MAAEMVANLLGASGALVVPSTGPYDLLIDGRRLGDLRVSELASLQKRLEEEAVESSKRSLTVLEKLLHLIMAFDE